MLGGSLSISFSRCAQKATARLPHTRQWRAREFRSCVRTAALGGWPLEVGVLQGGWVQQQQQ
eukprot:233125-Prymnesium_polylepis.1